MAGASMQTVARNAPMRFQTMVREQMPGGSYVADKPYAVAGLAVLLVAFFVKSMMPMASPPSAASQYANNMPLQYANNMPQRALASNRTMLEEFYKLGFDDAVAQKEFGESLPPVDDSAAPPTANEEYELPDYPMPPPANRGGKLMTISNAMSVLYLGRTAFDLGRNADGSWSFALFQQNVSTLEPWKLGLLGLSVYRLVSSVLT